MNSVTWSLLSQKRKHSMSYFYVYSKQNSITVWIWSIIAKQPAKSICSTCTHIAVSSERMCFLGKERGEKANKTLRNAIETWQVHFDPEKPIILQCKASKSGKGSTVTKNPSWNWKADQLASQTLSSTSWTKGLAAGQWKNLTNIVITIAAIYIANKLHLSLFS